MGVNKKFLLRIGCILFLTLISGYIFAENNDDNFQMTLLHVNDTHSHLEGSEAGLVLNGEKAYAEIAGFSRVASKIKDIRAKIPNLLVLHAGDAVQGTLYFTKYKGLAEVDFNNLIAFDAMAVGNHEFDKGSGVLANFIRAAQFPVLAANCDVSGNHNLKGLIRPYIVKVINGNEVGIIGLITPDTEETSSPDADIVFNDARSVAEDTIQTLAARGINKIILLTHLGYERDIELAQQIDGIDLIVGGHTHTLLGDLTHLGLNAEGPYPTIITGPSGQSVCIVQAWKWADVLGKLNVTFNEDGHILDCSGNPIILAGDTFKQKDAEGKKVEVGAVKRNEILSYISEASEIDIVEDDPEAAALLAPYKAGIDKEQHQVIASVTDDLWHVRDPGSLHPVTGEIMENGSFLAPLSAEAMLWKVNSVGIGAKMAILNAGGVRTDIQKGDLTVGKVYEVFPFGDTLYVLDLTGKEIKDTLEIAVSRAQDPTRDGAFPYVGGARYTADVTAPEGKRIVSLEIKTETGQWRPVEQNTTYRVVTLSYLADGGDGYTVLSKTEGYRYDTGFTDAGMFMDYAKVFDPLKRPESTGVTYKKF
jgi:5'-nucleotidase / UDP-sugar diphosphatase